MFVRKVSSRMDDNLDILSGSFVQDISEVGSLLQRTARARLSRLQLKRGYPS